MSYTLGPLAISTAGPLVVPVGTSSTVGAVVVGNESPYAVSAQAGGSAVWALAQMANRLNCNSSAFNGNITLTADSYLSNQNEAPSYVVFLEVYAPGEAIPGSYPCSLTRMSNVGNPSNSGGAANVIEQDLLTPFVLNGLVASKDGSIANQLDVTAGVALARQADQSLGRLTPASATFDTSAHSTTYFLDLQTDGSWSWATSHSTQSNYLTIAQVTTDASGNISGVTDERQLATTFLAALSGLLTLPQTQAINLLAQHIGVVSFGDLIDTSSNSGTGPSGTTAMYLKAGGSGNGVNIQIPNGTNAMQILASGFANIGGQAAVGFGAPVIVAQAINTHVTSTGAHTILTYGIPATGVYRFSCTVYNGSGSTQRPSILATYTGGNSSGGSGSNLTSPLGGPFDGTTTALVSGTDFPLLPQVIYLKAGANFVLQYTSGAASPNDNITVILERLS